MDEQNAVATDPPAMSPVPGLLARWARYFLDLAWRSLRHHALLLVVVLSYLLAGSLVEVILGVEVRSKISAMAYAMTRLQLIVAFTVFGFYLVYVALVVRPEKIFLHAYHELRQLFGSWELWAYAVPVLVLLPPFFATFTALKILIPVINPFTWDPAFAEWDRLLHGGRHPWEWLYPLLGHPWATYAMQKIYQFWLLSVYAVMLWQLFNMKDKVLRMQFFISFLLSWALIGSLAATLLSSAGPVYFERVTGLADPYAPLMEHIRSLEGIPGFRLASMQDWLWSNYANEITEAFTGISAMPSMHIGSVTLMALVAWRTHRYLGILLTVFASIIMLGSVHLAWHYAIDGYVAALVAILIWAGTGYVLRRWPVLLGPVGAPSDQRP